MKLMIIIMRDADSECVVQSLVKNDFRVTHMASSGGFLRRGNSTLLVGVEDEQVERVASIVKGTCEPADQDNQYRATTFVVDMPFRMKI